MSLKIRPATPEDASQINHLMATHWGGEPLIIRAKAYYPSQSDGLLALQNSEIIGFLCYEIQGTSCEIVVFEVFDKFKGVGSQMLEELKIVAKNQGCSRVYLMTTNDNLDALRFYQRRGFHICAIHLDSVKHSRKLKPGIPRLGNHGIPLRDEIDLERLLTP